MTRNMSKIRLAVMTAAAISLAAASPIRADTAPGATDRAEQALKEGADKIMRALELMIRAIPQYEMPEVLENGDIIIRRRNPDAPERKSPPRSGTDETST